MSTFAERVRRILREREDLNPSAWCTKAQLSRRAIKSLFDREKDDPDTEMSISAVAGLAQAAGVSFEWLALGVGQPYEEPPRPGKDPRYPSRTGALIAARALGYADDAIATVASIADLPTDPGADHWLAELRAANNRVRLAQAPSGDDAAPQTKPAATHGNFS